MNDKDKTDLIQMVDDRNEFGQLVDGFVYFWPRSTGAISAWMLRAIADELDRRNEQWNKGALWQRIPDAVLPMEKG